ncbi:MAG: gamma-glutamyltransferase [Ottowia sp.]|nr:gamma-glutamyltransferase [Ottowia sp.]
MHRNPILRLGLLAAALVLSACSGPQRQQAVPVVQRATAVTQAAAAAYDYDFNVFHSVVASHGMVVAEQALASQVGLDVLKRGGNAVDAAVAMGFALGVTLPYSGNTGGGGFMMVHDAATGQDVALDFREVAPQAATRDMYLDAQGNVIDGMSLHTHAAVGVPGTVAGLTHALQRWGSLPLAQLMQPAIAQAENGYPVSETLATVIEREKDNLGQWPASRAIFFRDDGTPLQRGDTLVQKDLATSLRLIAQGGASAFYRGPIADKIAAEMARHGGLISKQDLADYRVVEREPIRGTYRGYEVVTMPPPSSGGIHIVQLLNMMAHWPLQEWGHNSARSVHHMAEAMKLVYADRAEYLGDTDFVQVPVRGLLSRDYAAELVQKISDDRTLPAAQVKPGHPQAHEGSNTTHYSVMDKDGNMVAVTYTLNTHFGSGIVAEGTGIVLNNEMDDFSAKPGVPNVYGLIGGEANAIEARKRPLSSMSPTLVLKDGQPWLITGSPGGARIITTVLQILSNTMDYGMDPAEATASLRFHQQWTPDEIRVEQGFSVDTIALLRQRGQSVVVKPAMGRTQTIQVRDGQLLGFSDPRNPDGAALGY